MDGYNNEALPSIDVDDLIQTSTKLVTNICSTMDLKLLYKDKLQIETNMKITKTELSFYLKKMEWATYARQAIEITE